jgi:putative DNA primase/helicase
MADGTGTAIGVRVYADPDLEALRVAITDAEVIQAIGRGRGVWRDAEAPLDVFVFADVVLPIPVTRIARWADIRLDPIARMIARGIALTSPADAATVFPDLFPSQEAAKKALQRAGAEGYFGDKSLGIYIPRGMSPKSGLVGVSYRPEGRGQQQRRAYVRPDLVAGVRAWLTERLGPLAQCDEPSLPDPIISPAVAKAAHPAPKPPSAQEPPMPANDAPLPAARIEPLRPDEVYPPLKPHSPIMPIEGVWRVTTGKGPPRVIITSPEPPVTIHGRATTPFPPFCRGHFAPLTVPQEARQ